jgi:hypothetical protein
MGRKGYNFMIMLYRICRCATSAWSMGQMHETEKRDKLFSLCSVFVPIHLPLTYRGPSWPSALYIQCVQFYCIHLLVSFANFTFHNRTMLLCMSSLIYVIICLASHD